MNLIVKERKLEFWDIISQGWKIFWFKFRDIFFVSIIAQIPTYAISFLSSTLSQDLSGNTSTIFILIFLFIITIFLGLISSMSVATIVENIVDGKDVTLLEVIKESSNKWGGAFVTMLLSGIIQVALTLLFVIPGIIYSVYYFFVLYAFVLRDKYASEALSYSKKLIEGQWWRIFGITLGIGFVFGIPSFFVAFVFTSITDNFYLLLIPNLFFILVGMIVSVIYIVLFLNSDFVYHRRLVKRAEIKKARKKDSPINVREKNVAKVKTKNPKIAKIKRSSSKKVISKRVTKKTK